MKNGLLLALTKDLVDGGQFENVDASEIPAMGGRDAEQFLPRFGQGDIKATLAARHAFKEELQGERRFARTRRAFEQVNPIARQPAEENRVEPWITGRNTVIRPAIRRGVRLVGGNSHIHSQPAPIPSFFQRR
jgi:hypothetical protein